MLWRWFRLLAVRIKGGHIVLLISQNKRIGLFFLQICTSMPSLTLCSKNMQVKPNSVQWPTKVVCSYLRLSTKIIGPKTTKISAVSLIYMCEELCPTQQRKFSYSLKRNSQPNTSSGYFTSKMKCHRAKQRSSKEQNWTEKLPCSWSPHSTTAVCEPSFSIHIQKN